MGIYIDADLDQQCFIEVAPLVASIPGIDQRTAGSEAWSAKSSMIALISSLCSPVLRVMLVPEAIAQGFGFVHVLSRTG